MKKLAIGLSVFLVLFGSAMKTDAQYYYFNKDYYDTDWIYEIGGGTGIINCLTDLGGKKGKGKPFIKDLNPGLTHLNYSIFGEALYKNKVGIRLEYTMGKISAYDSILKPVADNSSGRYQRNLSFRSNISEFSLMVELHPRFIFIDWPGRDQDPPRLSPYILAGVGYFHFNPQARIGARWVDLQPLHTEGEGFAEYPGRKEYKLNQFNIPFGLGVKYELTGTLNVRLEFVPRILFTDYLDDVSTRYINPNVFQDHLSGQRLADALVLNDRRAELKPLTVNINPKGGQKRGQGNHDAYFTAQFKLSYTFGREKIE
jgi:opacity protein-like surface antigen